MDDERQTEIDLTSADYRALGNFRYQIRRFLHFSEMAALSEGLEPQQHQLLLAIRALDEDGPPPVGRLAEYMLIRHHSAVGLIDRLAERGLVERVRNGEDRRQVGVRLAPEGEAKLKRLSGGHQSELLNSGPELVEVLSALLHRFADDSRAPVQPPAVIKPKAEIESPAQKEPNVFPV